LGGIQWQRCKVHLQQTAKEYVTQKHLKGPDLAMVGCTGRTFAIVGNVLVLVMVVFQNVVDERIQRPQRPMGLKTLSGPFNDQGAGFGVETASKFGLPVEMLWKSGRLP
jgi:hypothetical protein